MNSVTKLRMYHEILDAILEPVVQLQNKGGIPFSFTYKEKEYNVNLKVFLMVITGDTKGHDKLCGWCNSLALQVHHVCHHCDIPTIECDNAFYPWRHVLPDDVQALVKAHDHVGLKAISQHHVCNAVFFCKDSQLATQKLIMMFKMTVKRKHGNGVKFPISFTCPVIFQRT
jgi:hypothetical protein